MITLTQPGYIPSFVCSETADGKIVVDALDGVYSIQEDKLGKHYDWCGCGMGIGVIIGIVIGVLVVVAIIGGLVWWFVIRKKQQQQQGDAYGAMRDQRY